MPRKFYQTGYISASRKSPIAASSLFLAVFHALDAQRTMKTLSFVDVGRSLFIFIICIDHSSFTVRRLRRSFVIHRLLQSHVDVGRESSVSSTRRRRTSRNICRMHGQADKFPVTIRGSYDGVFFSSVQLCALRVVRDSGFTGPISLEYEGDVGDAWENTRRTKALVEEAFG